VYVLQYVHCVLTYCIYVQWLLNYLIGFYFYAKSYNLKILILEFKNYIINGEQ